MKRVLFVCSRNRLRSPTAEELFSGHPELEVASAGLSHGAVKVLTPELVKWAEVIFVMEKSHRRKLLKRFRPYLRHQKVICLNIPDDYEFMSPELVSLLLASVPKYLGIRL